MKITDTNIYMCNKVNERHVFLALMCCVIAVILKKLEKICQKSNSDYVFAQH